MPCISFSALKTSKSTWVYVLDEAGNLLKDEKGNYVFNVVPTTDYGNHETLECWRKAWEDACNAKFTEKDLPCVSIKELSVPQT